MNANYLELLKTAQALVADQRCPMCDAQTWKTPSVPLEVGPAGPNLVKLAPVTCGACGYTHFFVAAFLANKATEVRRQGNGH